MRTPRRRGHTTKRGSSALEFQVSLVVFALALAGVFPVVATQMKLAQRLDATMPTYSASGAGTTHYLIPPSYPWNGRCGPAWVQTTLPVPPPRTLDDADPSVTFTGGSQEGWETVSSASAYHGGFHRHPASPDGSGSVTWSFAASASGTTGLPPGIYAIYVTWPKAPDLSTQVPIQVLGAEPLDGGPEPVLDQTQAPKPDLAGFEGSDWQRLAHLYRISDGRFQVQLQADHNRAIVADAVRIVPTPRTVQLQSMQTDADGAVTLQAQVQ